MEAFSAAGESNLVFIINELDKAASGKGNGNPADVLLTLLDNLGFTDNYMECMVPTVGVYPIATANDKSQISAPLMSRFAVIEIPDYTKEEKKIIFSRFALPKVLKRMTGSGNGHFRPYIRYSGSGAGSRAYCSKCALSDRSKSCSFCLL